MSEHDTQSAFFAMLKAHENEHPCLGLAFAIPNGGKRDPVTAARLKREGVKAGVPDVFLPVPSGEYAGLWIEFKFGRNKPEPEQLAWMGQLERQGYETAICYSWQDAFDKVMAYLSLRK